MSDTSLLLQVAERIAADEDFAMRVGEDPRGALEAEGLSDAVVARVLGLATGGAVQVASSPDDVRVSVGRIAAAARQLAHGPGA